MIMIYMEIMNWALDCLLHLPSPLRWNTWTIWIVEFLWISLKSYYMASPTLNHLSGRTNASLDKRLIHICLEYPTFPDWLDTARILPSQKTERTFFTEDVATWPQCVIRYVCCVSPGLWTAEIALLGVEGKVLCIPHNCHFSTSP